MTKTKKAKIVIVGAGPGGYAAAFRAADLGLEVTLVDPEANPGGVCLYRGCIPSKALLHLAKVKQEFSKAEHWGIHFQEPKVDLEKINVWKKNVITKLTKGLGNLAKGRKINYIRGQATFASENTLEIKTHEDELLTLDFEKVILSTGSVPVELPNVPIDHEVVLDSTDALELKSIPKSMLVIGGGYIGLELGSVYASLGCQVSIAEMTSGLLPGADRDLVGIFEKEAEKLFEEVYLETKVEKVTVEGDKAGVNLSNGKGNREMDFEKILVAVGRKPNTGSLQLEKANIETDEKGFLKVDTRRKTTNENVYAIGDLTGEPLLAHKATHEGRVVAEVLAGNAGAAFDPKSIPGIVFTDPEIAWSGLTETSAKEIARNVKVIKFPWSASGKAEAMGRGNGMTKLIFDPETGRILGGGVVGKNAGILIPQICLAIEMAATAKELAHTLHPHPTLSETIMESAELFLGSATHLEAK